MAKYQRPDVMTTHIINPLIAALTKLGFSVRGSHVLTVYQDSKAYLGLDEYRMRKL